MTEHECKYEREWGQQAQTILTITKAVAQIQNCTMDIKRSVTDLSIKIAQQEQRLNDMPEHKWTDKIWSGTFGFVGGFAAMVARFIWWK